jgi:basic membrane protein A
MEAAKLTYGLKTGYLTPKSDSDRDLNAIIDEACRQYRVVILYGHDKVDNLSEKHRVFPGNNFILIEGTMTQEETSQPPGNVLEVGYRTEEASHLAGFLAARTSSTNNFGFIGGKDAQSQRVYYGFYDGVFSDRTSYVKTGLFNNTHNSDRLKMLAENLYNDGAQVVIHAVNHKHEATIAGIARQKNKKFIATSLSNTGSEVLATIIQKHDVVIEKLLADYNNKEIRYGQSVLFGFKEDALDFLRPESGITDALWKQIEDKRDKITNGTLAVPGNKNEFDSKHEAIAFDKPDWVTTMSVNLALAKR